MTVICYGDSNTYGYDPRGWIGGRYDAPWPEILADLTGWEVRNCGSCGRTIPKSAVEFPKDTVLIAVMLGTNDLLQGTTAAEAAHRMEAFLCTIPREKVLLLAPPPMVRGEWVPNEDLMTESRQLIEEYRALAHRLGLRFSGGVPIPMSYDGVHFTEDSHRIFAEQLRKEFCP